MSEIKTSSQDGVNIDEEALFSSFAGSICKDSYNNSQFVDVKDLSKGNFRGPRPFLLKNLPEGYFIEATADGMGTKGILVDAAKNHRLAAYDIVAMTASDVTRYGGIPLIFLNILDTAGIGKEGDEISNTYKSMMLGLAEVAKANKLVLLKGETAQVNDALGSDITDSKTKFNWSGVMIGAYHPNKMVTGETLEAGQVIIALKEEGFRCNGGTSVRKAFLAKYGEGWWKIPKAQADLKEAAHPSVLYDMYVNTLHGWFDKNFKPEIPLHLIIHLSGGAFREKLAKDILFPKKLSAEINDLWEPPSIMKKCAEWRNIEDEEFYEVWNGGQGMLLIVDEKDADYALKRATDFGIQAKIAGRITKEEQPQVSIKSKLTEGKIIIYK